MKNSKRKLNIVDIIIILFVIFIAGYGIMSAVKQMKLGGNDASVIYVIETEPIKTEMTEKLSKGDKLYSTNGAFLGEIENVEVIAATYEGFNSEGVPVYTKSEDKSIMYITVSAEASEMLNGYDMNGVLICAGSKYTVNTSKLYFEGDCVRVTKTENS